MTKYLLVLVGLTLGLGCKERESSITIVNIGHLDRNGIAKQLSIINKYSPKVIGLDFLLTTDSLTKDELLVKEIQKTKNLVLASTLHDFYEPLNRWDSIEMYHSKFLKGHYGFSNITVNDDSVFVPELPMRQYYRNKLIQAFSYTVADNSIGVKQNYRQNEDKDFYFARNSISRHFKVISPTDLLDEKFDRKDLTDKIVLMGHVSDTEDSFFIDKNKTKRISGVEIHASIIEQIIN